MTRKISTLLGLSVSLMLTQVQVNAQTWNLTGNTNATAASRLGTNNNIPLRLFTNNAEQVHINANVAGKVGFVGMGTTAPNTRLHVNGVITATGGTSTNWNFASRVAGAFTTNKIPRWNGTTFVSGALFDNGSSVGVGTSALAARLSVANTTINGIGTPGSIQIGATNSYNLVMDDNEVQTRYNGGANTMFLNYWGGDISLASSGASSYFGGNVGIGIYPSNRLHIKQNVANRAIQWDHESQGDYWSMGIGTFTLNCRFEYNGLGMAQISSADGTYSTISDKRLKQDIEPLPAMMDKIMQLKATSYYYKDSKQQATHKSIGFIAQEVEEVLPSIVRDFDDGYKGLCYSDFGVVAIKGLQELKVDVDKKNELIASQQQQIDDLKADLKKMETALAQCCINYSPSKAEMNNPLNIQKTASLEQNAPNPFSQETTIRYYLPANSTAELKIVSLEGQLVRVEPIARSGYGEVRISGSTMAAGTYTYTLIVNGKAVESKIMVLTR